MAFTDGVSESRNLARRINAHLSYSNALGEQLGIVGPEDNTDLVQSKPIGFRSSTARSSFEVPSANAE